jgi:hypothetical protein
VQTGSFTKLTNANIELNMAKQLSMVRFSVVTILLVSWLR